MRNYPKAAGIPTWHQQTLFHLAFPDTRETHRDMFTALEDFSQQSRPYPDAVKYAGLRGSSVTGIFSYAIARWLAQRFPDDSSIESASTDPETLRLLFRFLLPACEYEQISAGEGGWVERIRLLYDPSGGSSLSWILNLMEIRIADEKLKELLFHQLNIYLRWEIRDPFFNLSAMRLPLQQPVSCGPFPRSVMPRRAARKKLPAPVQLNKQFRQLLMDIARASLLFLYRETEPFTYASPDELVYFELENGFSIALYGMEAGRRLSVESYIGYLAFRNGIPMAYGGGWLFGQRCQFGIHIFPAFRGGGSGYLLAQLIRVYHQYFGASRFVVKPYQFGKQNPDAIRSGAFWYYYKAGFRPENKTLAARARLEWKKKKAQKTYRSTPALLRRFTGSPLYLELVPGAQPVYDAAVLSRHITSYINTRFGGNRAAALRYCSRELYRRLELNDHLPGISTLTWENWSLLLVSSLPAGKINSTFKKQLCRLLALKSRVREKAFILKLQSLPTLWTYWDLLIHEPVQPVQKAL